VDAAATALIHASMPLCASLGMRAHEMSPARVVLSLDWAEGLCTSAGMLHGGMLMALADAAGGAAAFANLPAGAAGTSTIESKTNFLGAVRGGTVVATSTPLHAGSSTIVVETELRSGSKLVAKTTQTQTVLRPRD
jgi:1,4-dihydroxy-2-naphthoyl-CoA hydrolase